MSDDEIWTKFVYTKGVSERERAISFARAIEQASRRSALEEAAQVAYAHNAIMATTTAQLIENAIRTLANGGE